MVGGVRILVVDQDFETRAELQKGLVRAQFIVAGGGGYGAEALSLASEINPSLVLVGVEDPPARALPTIESLGARPPLPGERGGPPAGRSSPARVTT